MLEVEAAQKSGQLAPIAIFIAVQAFVALDVLRRLFNPARHGLMRSCLLGEMALMAVHPWPCAWGVCYHDVSEGLTHIELAYLPQNRSSVTCWQVCQFYV